MGYVEFSELEFKQSIHVIDALDFPMIYSYHGSEKCEKTSHATTNHLATYIYVHIMNKYCNAQYNTNVTI